MSSRVIATIGFICLLICAMGSWTRIPLYALYPGPLSSGSPGYSPTTMHGFAVAAGLVFLGLLIYAYWRKSLAATLTFWALMILCTVVGLSRVVSDLSDLH